MVLENVSADELSIAIQRVGAGEAAKLGYFHALPYGEGGSGGSSDVLMIEAHVVQDVNSPPGFAFLDYTYPEPRSYPSFIDVLVLDPVTGVNSLNYNILVVSNTETSFRVRFYTLWGDPMNTDDQPPFDQRIAVRIEEFKPSVRMVGGLVV